MHFTAENRPSWSSRGCSFPEGSYTESWSMSASQEPKEGSGKQSNLSWVAWPVSHWAITHIQFGSLSTIVMLSYRKANTQSLEEACSVFHPETQEFIEHVVPVKVSDFRFIPLSTILLGFFFFFFFEAWMIEKGVWKILSPLWNQTFSGVLRPDWWFQWQDVRLVSQTPRLSPQPLHLASVCPGMS